MTPEIIYVAALAKHEYSNSNGCYIVWLVTINDDDNIFSKNGHVSYDGNIRITIINSLDDEGSFMKYGHARARTCTSPHMLHWKQPLFHMKKKGGLRIVGRVLFRANFRWKFGHVIIFTGLTSDVGTKNACNSLRVPCLRAPQF